MSLPLRPGGTPLQADVDGDGRRDNVTVRYAPRARASCGFVLVVQADSRVFAVRVPEWYKPPQDLRIRDWPFPEPYLGAAVKLDADRSQIVVARSHGASVANVSVYGLVDGKLVPLRFHPRTTGTNCLSFGRSGREVRTLVRSWRPADRDGDRPQTPRQALVGAGSIARGSRFWRIQRRSRSKARDEGSTHSHSLGIDAAPFTGCVARAVGASSAYGQREQSVQQRSAPRR